MIVSLVDQENSKPYTRLKLSLSFVILQGKKSDLVEWSVLYLNLWVVVMTGDSF
jgi:hypothetical protein